jgi:hypothetical protein
VADLLFADNPADAVYDVRFTASIGANDPVTLSSKLTTVLSAKLLNPLISRLFRRTGKRFNSGEYNLQNSFI